MKMQKLLEIQVKILLNPLLSDHQQGPPKSVTYWT